MRRNVPLLAVLVTLAFSVIAPAQAPTPPKTFCNPLDLDYGLREKRAQPSRHGADAASGGITWT